MRFPDELSVAEFALDPVRLAVFADLHPWNGIWGLAHVCGQNGRALGSQPLGKFYERGAIHVPGIIGFPRMREFDDSDIYLIEQMV